MSQGRNIHKFEYVSKQGQYSNLYLSLAKYLAKSFTWLRTLLKSYSNGKMKLGLNFIAKLSESKTFTYDVTIICAHVCAMS